MRALDGFAAFGRAEIGALGAIVDYLELTQRGRLPLLRPPVRETAGGLMQIDAATRRNLELTRSLAGGREGSLLAAIDRTVTGGGARLLETRLNAPSTDVRLVRARQDAVAHFHAGRRGRCGRCASALRRVPDLERALSRLALDRGGPRDLAAVRDGLAQAERLRGGARRASCRRCWRRRARRWPGTRRWSGCSTRRWWPSRRSWRGTAGSWRRGSTRSSTRPGGCATRGAA